MSDPGRYLIAPEYAPLDGPAIFLGGPIRGASFWQPEATRLIQAEDPRLHVCSPRRARAGEEVPVAKTAAGKFDDAEHGVQVAWERHYLSYCGASGVILFWLPTQSYEVPGREYAQTTRFELGKWEDRAAHHEAQLVVGLPEGFHGRRYLLDMLAYDCPQVPIFETLQETCAAAVRLAHTS